MPIQTRKTRKVPARGAPGRPQDGGGNSLGSRGERVRELVGGASPPRVPARGAPGRPKGGAGDFGDGQSPKCSPARKTLKLKTKSSNLHISHSCYTPQILETIKTAYNKANPDNKINETDPVSIWHALHAKLDHCEQEDCWLNTIKNAKLRKQIDRYVFAPDRPPEWDADPDAWLSNYDIMNVLEQYEEARPDFNFIGPTPIDFDAKPNGKCVWNELCTFNLGEQTKKYSQFGIIFNTDNHRGPGKHWISLYIDMSNGIMFYFDSANGKTPAEVTALTHRIQEQAKSLGKPLKYMRNHGTHQYSDTECGMYSLFFIITMLTGKVEGKPVDLKKRLNMFKGSKRIPDKYVMKYRHIYFGLGADRPQNPLHRASATAPKGAEPLRDA